MSDLRELAPRGKPARAYHTSFVGRERELQELRELLDGPARLVTVVGPPGIGKTRLVHELVQRETFGAREVVVCDVSEARSLSAFCETVVHALGERVDLRASAEELAGAAQQALQRPHGVLLVLDGVEHVAALVATTLAAWLREAAGVVVLASSREVLRVAGETVFDLAPLELPGAEWVPRDDVASVKLAIDRVRQLRRDYAPSETELAALGRIVRNVDGIPLAIELVAARVAMVGARSVVERTSKPLELLSHGPRDAQARSQTLRAALDDSWASLEPAEQSALAQCAVFRGGFDLDAAEAVLDRSVFPETLDVMTVLQSLREKSMLRSRTSPGGAQERLDLYGSIREYAEEKLRELGLLDVAFARHARYYAAAADAYGRITDEPAQRAMLTRARLEEENLLAAVRRCLDGLVRDPEAARIGAQAALLLCIASRNGTHTAEPLVLFDRAIEALRGAPHDPLLLARCLQERGMLRRTTLADLDGSWRDFEEALAIARTHGNAVLEGRLEGELGGVLFSRGDLDRAIAYLNPAIARLEAAGDRVGECKFLSFRANLLSERPSDLRRARDDFERALRLARLSGVPTIELNAQMGLAVTQLTMGRVPEAERGYNETLERARERGDRFHETLTLGNLGVLYMLTGRAKRAIEVFEQGFAVARARGGKRHEAMLRGYAGIALILADDLSMADEALRDATYGSREAHHRRGEALFTAYRGALAAARGEHGSAADSAAAAPESLDDANDPYTVPLLILRRFAELAAAGAPRREPGNAGAAALEMAGPLPTMADVRAVVPAAEHNPLDTQIALGVVEHLVARVAERAKRPANGTSHAFAVDEQGRWFRVGDGPRVGLGRRQVLRLLLAELVRRRTAAPGRGVPKDRLLEAAWPGQRILPHAADGRLRMALTTLRKLGLRELLLAQDDGYLLDPKVPLMVEREPDEN